MRADDAIAPGAGRAIALTLGLVLLVLLIAPFARYAATFGVHGLAGSLVEPTYLRVEGATASNLAVFGHMIAGAAVTLLAPLQLVPAIRRRFPRFHRATGYALIVAALFTAAGGLAFIALRGAIGGSLMDAGFAGYGLCLAVAAVMTLRRAREGDRDRHRDWAIRLFVLAVGSFLYRLHYALWHMLTGGVASAPDFSGLFDRVQNVAFYLPYLVALELGFRLRDRAKARRGAA